MKLCQVLAIESGVRNKSRDELTKLHRAAEKNDLYQGLERTYQPKDEDGERFPSEKQTVQLRYKDVLLKVKELMSEAYDVELTKDIGNLSACADVTIDGQLVLKQMPVAFLLYLEKQLDDLSTFVSKMPTLDPSETWNWDSNHQLWRNEPTETSKSKKKMVPVVLYPATVEHPAQVKESTEDILVGYWKNQKFSGCVSAERKELLMSRLSKLQQAVKFARELANSTEVEKATASDKVFSYLLEGVV